MWQRWPALDILIPPAAQVLDIHSTELHSFTRSPEVVSSSSHHSPQEEAGALQPSLHQIHSSKCRFGSRLPTPGFYFQRVQNFNEEGGKL